jgi:hypothetical protein
MDTFDELETWDPASSDPLQRANVPLIERNLENIQSNSGAKLLLCHDYKGGYHDYESSGIQGVPDEDFSLEYLQLIETFVYFSHHLVTIPPPSWINTLHRNGVKCLGTLIVEPATEGASALLRDNGGQNGSTTRFPLATKLAEIARYFGFDGWIINIEKPFPGSEWSLYAMLDFLRNLRTQLGPNKELVWYDALTSNNRISYQNSLSKANLPFFRACGKILTNYRWDLRLLQSSVSLAKECGLSSEDIYMGVDVFAQNKPVDRRYPRITFPEDNGGGTCTGMAVAECSKAMLSTGIFGPAWTFEHFGADQNDEAAQAMWEGRKPSQKLLCNCWDGTYDGDTHPVDDAISIKRHASEFPCGSRNYFWTDFSLPFSSHDEALNDLYDDRDIHAQLGAQSVPVRKSRDLGDSAGRPLWAQVQDNPSGLTVGVTPMMIGTPKLGLDTIRLTLELFRLNIAIPSDPASKCCFSLRAKAVPLSDAMADYGIYYRSDSNVGMYVPPQFIPSS